VGEAAPTADRWRVLDPPGAVVVAVPGRRRSRERVAAQLRALPPGTPVVLEDGRPGGRRRCRRLAVGGGVVVDRSYLALPSLQRALYRVEDTPTALRYFACTLLTTPPGLGLATVAADVAVRLVRAVAATPLPGVLAPGRLTLGHRA
jgi:hypothetical protein